MRYFPPGGPRAAGREDYGRSIDLFRKKSLEITFWQALGLLVLARIVFGGRGGHSFPRSRPRFSHEESERFRERMRARFCDKPAIRDDGEPPAAPQT